MATLLDEVVDYLETEGVGTFGTDLFIGYEPTTPTNTVTLYPTGGRPPKTDGKEYPSIQVRIRSEDYPTGYNKAMEIYRLLHKQTDFLNEWRGRCFALQSAPLFMGHGENAEFIFTQNYIWYISYNSS